MDIRLKKYIDNLSYINLKKMYKEIKLDIKQFKAIYKNNYNEDGILFYKMRIFEALYIRNKLRGV